MRIITSGSRYLDIDAYAGCIAYAELLQQQGITAQAVSLATLNESIPAIVRDWGAPLVTEYTPSSDDTYTLIDVSQPEYFESFVNPNHIDEVIDHHPGLEEYWHERIGDGAIIEHVGAACTQVYEKWEQSDLGDQISERSARLLMCGILDNTLNFGAAITNQRDKHAYQQLAKRANLPQDWPAIYFDACGQSILRDLAGAVKNDLKEMKFRTFPQSIALGQLAVWNADHLIHESFDTLKQVLGGVNPHWAMNLINIEDNTSHIITDVPELQQWFSNVLNIQFDDNIAIADRTWLRKEIMKADINNHAAI